MSVWIPVLPGDHVVLAVGVVVAALGFESFITGGNHGNTCREKQRADEVSCGFATSEVHRRVRSLALVSMVEAQVVVAAIAIAFAVGGVLLDVVGDQVPKRETVVGRDEVDGAEGRAFTDNILRPRNSACHLLDTVVMVA